MNHSRLHLARLLASLCLPGFLLWPMPGAAGTVPASATARLGIEVRETAGLARNGYPAHALLKLPQAVPATTKFRLLDGGKPVVAQFRPDRDGPTANWWLDFQTAIGPHETKQYTIEFGDDVPAGPERKNGHKLSKTRDAFVIANAPYITWTIPRELKGLLRSVDFPPSEFLRSDSPGLLLRDRQGRQHVLAAAGKPIRQGTMAVALRFEKAESEANLRKVHSTVDLTFPAPVSWVEVDWTIDDPLDQVAAIGLQLHLNLSKPVGTAPTLVDFGATGTVYTSLYHGQEAELSAAPRAAWRILRGDSGRLTPFANAPKQAAASRVEGWVHVMDRKNCLALAVDGFAREARDRIIVSADGAMTVWREYGPGGKAERKGLRSWLHFVFFPPQYSAGASPQQMQAPLAVRVTEP